MSRAYKCDRCGVFYTENKEVMTYALFPLNNESSFDMETDRMDLCDVCRKKLNDFMNPDIVKKQNNDDYLRNVLNIEPEPDEGVFRSKKEKVPQTPPKEKSFKEMLGIRTGSNNWTDEEIKILKEHYPNTPREQLLKMLPNRKWSAIKYKAFTGKIKRIIVEGKFGRKSNKKIWETDKPTFQGHYSHEENEYLKSLYGKFPVAQVGYLMRMAGFPNRTSSSYTQRANVLGLCSTGRGRVTKDSYPDLSREVFDSEEFQKYYDKAKKRNPEISDTDAKNIARARCMYNKKLKEQDQYMQKVREETHQKKEKKKCMYCMTNDAMDDEDVCEECRDNLMKHEAR
jgi:uncharacterized protein YuzB (UPF0349 family)